MRLSSIESIASVLVLVASGPTATRRGTARALLQADGGRAETARSGNDLKPNPGAMFAAAVLYTKQHPANPSFGDKKKLELALKLGDLYASPERSRTRPRTSRITSGRSISGSTPIACSKAELGAERRARWRREIEKITRWFAGEVAVPHRLPPLPGAVHPHLHQPPGPVRLRRSTWPGACWRTRSGRQLGARALHRLAAEEQTADGYWGEFTDNGPATGYNYLTMCCVALYWEHSRDPAALEALRRATDFHKHFTWPDGTPVETINGRNRHWDVSPWGQFGFTHWPDGRRYAEFLAGLLRAPES